MQVANVADEATRILREWSEIRLFEAAAVLAAGFALSNAIKWTVPRFAGRLPYRFRIWVLPWEPILRFLAIHSSALGELTVPGGATDSEP